MEQQATKKEDSHMFSGNIYIFYAFDIGDEIELEDLARSDVLIQHSLTLSKYFKNYHIPLSFRMSDEDLRKGLNVVNASCIFSKVYSFGVLSFCYRIPFEDTFEDLKVKIIDIKKSFDEKCRATVGIIAGTGRTRKPFLKAGRKHHLMKSKGRKWHLTSKVKVNAIDHPFGGGRGKRIKSKIAKRNAPPGRRVGHLRPRRTGRKKR